MSNYARKLVSGGKARFKDDELDVDLDLVYVTDRVIIMGYPAEGIEAFYRNSRHDARKFLEHRHGLNYWIFNFCPLTENSYPADFFHGHVSRYPFPDHHAPPLAIMALATREVDLWLRANPEHVAVLHCKAGKGRSGTLACSYLLTLEEPPSGPQLQRSYSNKEWANRRALEMMDAVEEETDDELEKNPRKQAAPVEPASTKEATTDEVNHQQTEGINPGDHVKIAASSSDSTPAAAPNTVLDDTEHTVDTPKPLSPVPTTTSTQPAWTQAASANASNPSLDSILALHSSRRMKSPSKSDSKPKRGVSIPSQRRFLYYWSQVLSHAGPPGFWQIGSKPVLPPNETGDLADLRRNEAQSVTNAKEGGQRVRIQEIKIRIEDLGGPKTTAIKMINKVLEKAARGKIRGSPVKGKGDVWVSLARYDDGFVSALEEWEKYTRGEGPKGQELFGRRKPGTESLPEDKDGERGIATLFDRGEYDNGKMVKSFARMGTVEKRDVLETKEDNKAIITHTLHPLPQSEWVDISKHPKHSKQSRASTSDSSSDSASDDSVSTISIKNGPDLTQSEIHIGEGIVVDAEREVRVKLYIGQVPMGWFWFIPAFHMPHSSTSEPTQPQTVRLRLEKSDIDFPLGAGAWIIDVDVALEWVSTPHQNTDMQTPPPASQVSNSVSGEVPAEKDEPNGVIGDGATAKISETVEAVKGA